MLQQEGKKSIISHVPPNPSLAYAESIKLPWDTEEIISIGGGSTIDVAKWVADRYKIRHTAIPTTAGTGSEVTKYCVLMVDGKKVTFNLKEPDSYILNPKLVVSLPPLQTLSTGLDALSQACEALWSTNATPESKSYSTMAIDLILGNLRRCLEQPQNEIYRMNMLLGANFSGKAINITQTNVCHAISYPLTEIYGIPHGIACAMSLEYFSTKAGIDLSMFLMQLAIPKQKVDKDRIADIVMQSPKLKGYPHPVSREDIIASII